MTLVEILAPKLWGCSYFIPVLCAMRFLRVIETLLSACVTQEGLLYVPGRTQSSVFLIVSSLPNELFWLFRGSSYHSIELRCL